MYNQTAFEQKEKARLKWVATILSCVETAAKKSLELTSEDIMMVYDNLPKTQKIQYRNAGLTFYSILQQAKRKGIIKEKIGSYKFSTARTSYGRGKPLQVWESNIYEQPNLTSTKRRSSKAA